ncbi:LppX_LprAFG lipoprotein [Actinomadura macrotermitis]|uniref:Lipoarabinomannan carrier protein LprG n=1 Tax=Actinomadura macrotermitis TaxID=2585200 RepID=A0A7K0BN46_9ACTN|nr:LppX_LprAFG lipoprotein [Actinomadura macrotermitis]MQY02608.1 Lipoarabinomannan carrier protein LprG [Actinomadura macrotermitis]
MPIRRSHSLALVPAALALTLLTACSGDGKADDKKSSAPLPDASATLQQASQAMASLKSVGFTLSTEDKPQIMVKSGDMKLLKSGDAQGTIQVEQSGQAVEMKIVSVGDSIYLDAGTGGWRKVPKALASTMYDPSAVLDPNRGIAKLLTSVQGSKAEATEKVDGKEASRVAVKLPKDAVGGLIPGVNEDVDGKLWISTSDHRLLKVKGNLPGADGGKGAVIINFTEFDKPYKISAPK